MNVFTNLFFPQGQQAQPHPFDKGDDRYAHGYGNRIASARVFSTPLTLIRTSALRGSPRLSCMLCAMGGRVIGTAGLGNPPRHCERSAATQYGL